MNIDEKYFDNYSAILYSPKLCETGYKTRYSISSLRLIFVHSFKILFFIKRVGRL